MEPSFYEEVFREIQDDAKNITDSSVFDVSKYSPSTHWDVAHGEALIVRLLRPDRHLHILHFTLTWPYLFP